MLPNLDRSSERLFSPAPDLFLTKEVLYRTGGPP
jgi:hypothetical protein